MKKYSRRQKWSFFLVLLTASAAAAGVHAYTHNLKFQSSLLNSLYWAEQGSTKPSIRMGE